MSRPVLTGLGMGPGDPELVTVKAVTQLQQAEAIFVPVMAAPDSPGAAGDVASDDVASDDVASADIGRAEAIVRHHLGADPRIHRLPFALNDAVTGTQSRRRMHWQQAADRVASWLQQGGRNAVFATIGDPGVYSTFTYLADAVREVVAELEVRTVPGITAMQAAASAAGIALVEGAEPLTLLPMVRAPHRLTAALREGGTVVAYKGGRQLRQLRGTVEQEGALERAVFAEHLGGADARVRPLEQVDDESAAYLSTVVITPERGGRGEQL